MAFFDDFTKKAKDLAYVGASKAKDAAEIAKINVNIASEQREMDKQYKAIGQWFVNEYQGDLPDTVRVMVEAVEACKCNIEALEASKGSADVVADVVQDPACPICGEQSAGKFCQKCGAPMDC